MAWPKFNCAMSASLQKMWDGGVVSRFDPQGEGHNATDYDRWFTTSSFYQVQYQYRYEPWVVADR